MSYLRLDSISKSHRRDTIVRGLTLELARGSALGLFGPTGCGKTTVLRLIAGLDRPDSGMIEIDGKVVCGNGRFISAGERRIGMVFQHLALWPHMNVERQIEFVLKERHRDKVERKRVLDGLIERAQLGHRRHSLPAELSGGESQCLAIARALASAPQLLLVDEPGAHLDASLRKRMLDWLTELRQNGLTLILVTHDREEIRRYCDEVIVMDGEKYSKMPGKEL